MASVKRLLWVGAVLLAPAAANAEIINYVQSANCENCVSIGVPVPLPVQSQTAVTGFRAYESLISGLQDLWATTGLLSSQSVGATLGDEPILAFRLGDTDATTAEGFPEPAVLFNGAIHAREWAAPEVVAAYAERLLGNRSDAGLHQFLIENVNAVLIPVLNVDGFLQTQRFPNQAGTEIENTSVGPGTEPRDGRLRRKNLRKDDGTSVDADLGTEADRLLGVDVNRNNQPFCGQGGSGDPNNLTYRGDCGNPEAEARALQAAVPDRLRFFVDLHSYQRALLSAETGARRRDTIQQQLAATMSRTAGNGTDRYPYGASSPGSGIGSTDEFFANTYGVPAYTLEIEPRNGLSDYSGGINVSNSGFILPAAELPRVRQELTDALVLGTYRQVAGPPVLLAAEIRQSDDDRVIYSARWVPNGNDRRLQVDVREPLQTDTDYRLWLAFDKPMRIRDDDGAVTQFRGQNVPLAPAIAVEGTGSGGAMFRQDLPTTADGWLSAQGGAPDGRLRYADDAYAIDFRLPANVPLAQARRVNLRVDARDLSGQALDANPATVLDWDAGWSAYEDEDGNDDTDTGGADRTQVLAGEANAGGGGGGGGAFGGFALALGLLLRLRRSRRMHLHQADASAVVIN